MNNCLPYVPDIDRLLNTFQKMDGSILDDWIGDVYASFWLEENAVATKNKEYNIVPSFLSMAKNEKDVARCKKLDSEVGGRMNEVGGKKAEG